MFIKVNKTNGVVERIAVSAIDSYRSSNANDPLRSHLNEKDGGSDIFPKVYFEGEQNRCIVVKESPEELDRLIAESSSGGQFAIWTRNGNHHNYGAVMLIYADADNEPTILVGDESDGMNIIPTAVYAHDALLFESRQEMEEKLSELRSGEREPVASEG